MPPPVEPYPVPQQPPAQSPLDSPLAQILIPLASAAISAYSPRYGAAGVQGGLSALGAMQQHSMNNMRMRDVAAQQAQEQAESRAQQERSQRLQDFIRSQQSRTAPNGGNAPAAQAAIQNNVFEATNEVPRPGTAFHDMDPAFLESLQFMSEEDAARRLADVLARPAAQPKGPDYKIDLITTEDGDRVYSRLDPATMTVTQQLASGPEPTEEKQPRNVEEFDAYFNSPENASKTPAQRVRDFALLKRQPPAAKEPLPPGELSPTASRRVDNISRQFGGEQVVKNTQLMAEAVSFADKLNPNTTNPADDQALIYAFAKAMDPNSVVREGEYAVVQKYAQSWAQKIGFDAARIFSNTQFLSPQARQNMKNTIRAKYAAGRAQYDSLSKSYIDRLNRIPGVQNGADYLVDYAGAFPSTGEAAPAPGTSVGAEPTATNPKTGEKVVFRNGQWQSQ